MRVRNTEAADEKQEETNGQRIRGTGRQTHRECGQGTVRGRQTHRDRLRVNIKEEL